MNRLITISAYAYLMFVSFYNLYGNEFSVKVNLLMNNLYYLVNSILLACTGVYIALKCSTKSVGVLMMSVGVYNVFLTIFNIFCAIRVDLASNFIYNTLLSGLSILIIFIVILIASKNG
jgi:hypothetical protein